MSENQVTTVLAPRWTNARPSTTRTTSCGGDLLVEGHKCGTDIGYANDAEVSQEERGHYNIM